MKKNFYTFEDIMERYGCGRDKAYSIIRSVKSFCGGGKLGCGKVLESELVAWEKEVK